MEHVEAKRKSVNNFKDIEEYMDFSGSPCFYKFALIVRNKDGKTPLVQKDAPSGEMLVKEYFVDSKEYYAVNGGTGKLKNTLLVGYKYSAKTQVNLVLCD